MSDDDARTPRIQMGKAAGVPAFDDRGALWRDLDRCLRPAVDQQPLHVVFRGPERPVTGFATDTVPDPSETLLRAYCSVRSRGGTAQSLIRSLVPVHQLAHHFVLVLGRSTCKPAVVGNRKECKRASRATVRGQGEQRQVEGAKIALQHNLGLGGACVVTMYGKAR